MRNVGLGLFGNTLNTRLLIPHKVYEAMAMRKALITSDTPAARELLVDRENAILCKAADPQSFADTIRLLKNDGSLRDNIAGNGYETFNNECSPRIIGREILQIVKQLLQQT